jgi:hypothetical protein
LNVATIRKSFDVFADYLQFYLWDRDTDPQAPEEYTDADVERRIKTAPHVVAIKPERPSRVPETLEIHDADPGYDATAWDHIVEASLHLPTGHLQVHECTGGPVADFDLAPGWYRVRSLHSGLATIDGLKGKDRYQVVLWPAPSRKARVIKQWVREG